MNVYIIDRIDEYSYDEYYKAVVVAKDELHAERLARLQVLDWKKAKLKVTKVDLNEEVILSMENIGA